MNRNNVVAAALGAILALGGVYYGVVHLPRKAFPTIPIAPPLPAPPAPPAPKPRPRPCPGPGPCPRPMLAGGRPVVIQFHPDKDSPRFKGYCPCSGEKECKCGYGCDCTIAATAGERKPTVGGPVSPDGAVEITVDLPASEKKPNIPSKGLGCCVFRSIEYAARWQQVPELYDLPEQMVKAGIEGGGYPDKVDRIMAKFGKGVPYVQDTSGDPAVLEQILASGRLPCVTYNGHDPHYSGSIAHMVTCVYFDRSSNWACISDNNYPGSDQFVWMDCGSFLRRWNGSDRGWVVALLDPGPPPPPRNARRLPVSPLARPANNLAVPALRAAPGLDPKALGAEKRRHIYCGREVSGTRLQAILESAAVPNDALAPYLTVIGSSDQLAAVARDLATSPDLAQSAASWKSHLYLPTDWAVAGLGFALTGAPAVYLQAQDGTVLRRFATYDGASNLACALRRADPSYDPALDDPAAEEAGLGLALAAGGIVIGLLYLSTERSGR